MAQPVVVALVCSTLVFIHFGRLLDLVFLFCFVIVHLLIVSGLMKITFLSTDSLYYSVVRYFVEIFNIFVTLMMILIPKVYYSKHSKKF